MVEKRRGAGNGCPHFRSCGGCQLQNMEYEEQLGYKERRVIGLLGSFCHVSDIIPMENPLHYRHKVQIAYAQLKSGGLISGVWQSSKGLVSSMDECMIDHPQCDAVGVSIRKLMAKYRIPVYNSFRDSGIIRFALIRRSRSSGKMLVALGVGRGRFPKRREFVSELLSLHPDISTLLCSTSCDERNLVLGKNTELLFGDGFIEDSLCGKTFRMGAQSFFQVNPEQTQKLYSTAIDLAELTGEETVIDAYCGVGTIGIIASDRAKKVISVENSEESFRFARQNAKLNAADKVELHCMDAGKFLTRMARDGKSAQVVFTDPPRAGCSSEFLASLIDLAPEKIVYISCNPETQARDLSTLTKAGYKVRKIVPVDMFPHTNHVECVVLMSKANE